MMHIDFESAWLLILSVIAFLAYRCPQLGLLRPLRLLAMLAVMVLLCYPSFPSRRGGDGPLGSDRLIAFHWRKRESGIPRVA